jgi:hypothetical protein
VRTAVGAVRLRLRLRLRQLCAQLGLGRLVLLYGGSQNGLPVAAAILSGVTTPGWTEADRAPPATVQQDDNDGDGDDHDHDLMIMRS